MKSFVVFDRRQALEGHACCLGQFKNRLQQNQILQKAIKDGAIFDHGSKDYIESDRKDLIELYQNILDTKPSKQRYMMAACVFVMGIFMLLGPMCWPAGWWQYTEVLLTAVGFCMLGDRYFKWRRQAIWWQITLSLCSWHVAISLGQLSMPYMGIIQMIMILIACIMAYTAQRNGKQLTMIALLSASMASMWLLSVLCVASPVLMQGLCHGHLSGMMIILALVDGSISLKRSAMVSDSYQVQYPIFTVDHKELIDISNVQSNKTITFHLGPNQRYMMPCGYRQLTYDDGIKISDCHITGKQDNINDQKNLTQEGSAGTLLSNATKQRKTISFAKFSQDNTDQPSNDSSKNRTESWTNHAIRWLLIASYGCSFLWFVFGHITMALSVPMSMLMIFCPCSILFGQSFLAYSQTYDLKCHDIRVQNQLVLDHVSIDKPRCMAWDYHGSLQKITSSSIQDNKYHLIGRFEKHVIVTGSQLTAEEKREIQSFFGDKEYDIHEQETCQGKGSIIADLKNTYHVTYLGDGYNDTDALFQADLGIAIDREDHVNKTYLVQADMVIQNTYIDQKLLACLDGYDGHCRRLGYIYGWFFGFNAMALSFAGGLGYALWGIIWHPMLACVLMFSSTLVVLIMVHVLKADTPSKDSVNVARPTGPTKADEFIGWGSWLCTMCRHTASHVDSKGEKPEYMCSLTK